MCARGASALADALERYPKANVRVLVVWLPALATDRGPPDSWARVRDPRVTDFWDPKVWMSPRVVRRAEMMAASAGESPPVARGQIVFDFVGVFPPGAKWEEPFPVPSAWGAPVEGSLGVIEAALISAP